MSAATVTVILVVGWHERWIRAEVYPARRSPLDDPRLHLGSLEVEGPHGWQPLRVVSPRHAREISELVQETYREHGTDQEQRRDFDVS